MEKTLSQRVVALGAFLLVACSSSDEGNPVNSTEVVPEGANAGASSSVGGAVGSDATSGSSGGSAGSTEDEPSGGGQSGGADSGGEPSVGGAGGNTPGVPHKFSIAFDYRFDDRDWFGAGERRGALEAAAATWSTRIQDDFEEIPVGTLIRIRNLDNVDDTFMDFEIDTPIDDLLIFVACSDVLIDLGVGARTRRAAIFPGSMGIDFQNRLSDRWKGKDQEPWAVGIAYACHEDRYFFDPTPGTMDDIPQGKIDFISLTTHEIGHALGLGSSQTFLALADEQKTQFSGEQAVQVANGPIPLDGGGHVDSQLLIDGLPSLMTSRWPADTRIRPRRLEFAMLQDLGYEITSP